MAYIGIYLKATTDWSKNSELLASHGVTWSPVPGIICAVSDVKLKEPFTCLQPQITQLHDS